MSAPARPARGRLALWFGAWLLSIAALLPWPAEGLAAFDRSLAGLPLCALAWLPWLAVAGLPESSANERPSWGVALGLALPSVALATWTDGRSGLAAPGVWSVALLGLLLFACLLASARLAARARLGWYPFVWMLWVLAAPSFAAALEWATRGQLGEGGLARGLARLSPLGAVVLDALPLSAPRDVYADLLFPQAVLLHPALLAAVVVLLAVSVAARAAGEREA